MPSTLSQASTGIVLLAHGSRDPLWRLPIEAVRDALQAMHPAQPVTCAYLELCPPTLETTVQTLAAQGCTCFRIVPMFLGRGAHARSEIPHMVEQLQHAHPAWTFELRTAIGEDPRVTALLAQLAAEDLSPIAATALSDSPQN